MPNTVIIRHKSNFIPNRSVKYVKIAFQKNNTEEKSKNKILNVIPKGLPPLGGGNNTYRTDVPKNHNSVGNNVYPHDSATTRIFPLPPKHFPTTKSSDVVTIYVTTTESAMRINCLVITKGLNAAVFTSEAIAK